MLPIKIKGKTTESRITLSNPSKRYIHFSLSWPPCHGDAALAREQPACRTVQNWDWGSFLLDVRLCNWKLSACSLLPPLRVPHAQSSPLHGGEAGSKRKMHLHVWSSQQTSKVREPKLAPSAERNKSPILSGLCVAVSFQPSGTRVRHKRPDRLKVVQGPPQPSGGVIMSSTLIALLAMKMVKTNPLCLSSFTCSDFYDAVILPPERLVFFTGFTFTRNKDAASLRLWFRIFCFCKRNLRTVSERSSSSWPFS